MVAGTQLEVQNYDDFVGFLEIEAHATLVGSFRDQFPASDGAVGHNPRPNIVPWNNFVDMNSIQLYASRSLDDGSITTSRIACPVALCLIFANGVNLK